MFLQNAYELLKNSTGEFDMNKQMIGQSAANNNMLDDIKQILIQKYGI